MQSEGEKQIDVVRLKAELAAAGVELLSAHCATDRIRLSILLKEVSFRRADRPEESIALRSRYIVFLRSKHSSNTRRLQQLRDTVYPQPAFSRSLALLYFPPG